MAGATASGVGSICCLLHNLIPGGSGWQWVHLLAHHVAGGGRATIAAPPGLLADPARAAGIEILPFSWADDWPAESDRLMSVVGRHDFAVVHWDHEVMETFDPALSACGRAALTLHQAPDALARWFGPEIMPSIRAPIASAVAAERATAMVRGEWHRDRVVTDFDLPGDGLSILPASIPLASARFQPELGEPREILALMRLSPDKEAIAQLGIDLTRRRLAARRPCRLTIAGEGPWHDEAAALCDRLLPSSAWRIEKAPAHPVARLSASDLIVAQGLTTLEAAAIGRRVVVARITEEGRGAGVVLTPDRYAVAAQDPFGKPDVTADVNRLWEEILMVDEEDLRELRRLVETRNSLEVAARALSGIAATTAG